MEKNSCRSKNGGSSGFDHPSCSARVSTTYLSRHRMQAETRSARSLVRFCAASPRTRGSRSRSAGTWPLHGPVTASSNVCDIARSGVVLLVLFDAEGLYLHGDRPWRRATRRAVIETSNGCSDRKPYFLYEVLIDFLNG